MRDAGSDSQTMGLQGVRTTGQDPTNGAGRSRKGLSFRNIVPVATREWEQARQDRTELAAQEGSDNEPPPPRSRPRADYHLTPPKTPPSQ